MTKTEFLDKSISFFVKLNNLHKYLREKQHEYNNSEQIQRAGTSIGANYSEAYDARDAFFAELRSLILSRIDVRMEVQ